MADHQDPFADVLPVEGGFSLPELKWRELLFVGALSREGDVFIRDPARPLPPFRREGLFPETRTRQVLQEAERSDDEELDGGEV